MRLAIRAMAAQYITLVDEGEEHPFELGIGLGGDITTTRPGKARVSAM
jgi:hypothetical protein